MKSRLFYAGQLVGEYSSWFPSMSQFLHTNWGLEIYNWGYLYASKDYGRTYEWFRADGTPVLLEDVPRELRMLNLLLS